METPIEGIQWNSLGFSQTKTDFMVTSRFSTKIGRWEDLQVVQYGPVDVEPASAALNYGFSVFEGVKAFRSEDGSVQLFRPDMNAARFKQSAERMNMAAMDNELFIDAMCKVIAANSRFVPPCGEGALYLRPLLFASNCQLAAETEEFTFVVFASPTGNYFTSVDRGLRVLVTETYNRSAIDGVGFVKASGNYPATMLPKKLAIEKGFDDVLYTDSNESRFVEEASASNLFFVRDGKLYTPDTSRKTIHEGITRASLIYLARNELGMEVVDSEPLTVDMLKSAEEVFLSGTAIVIARVKSLTFENDADQEYKYPSYEVGKQLKEMLMDIQNGKRKAPSSWLIVDVPSLPVQDQ
ncbi:hypothetical protein NDN08_005183 [Rhodosorus marinus]|uniref:Branched-chain-amino-acid transaminase n=1 Tax=Rhodosorus marinus TaxID=101924 RepID=A0AAV8V161_9RHOD|nr:hypothetical protein NDN08_005183 [Rhodosorus marinus]